MADPADPESFEFPDGSTPATRALRAALPTSRHAEMLLDMVRVRLGADAVLEVLSGGNLRLLFRRARHGFVPWPLVRFTRGADRIVEMPWLSLFGDHESWKGDPPAPPTPPPPKPLLALRGLGPGRLTLYDGAEYVQIAYGADGRAFETARSVDSEAHHPAARALASGAAGSAELAADYVAGIDHGRHGAGRVHYPVELPCGLQGAWNVGLWGVRRALFEGPIPVGARWVVADGFAGTTVAWGPTRDAAFQAWRESVQRAQPVPPPPPPPRELPEQDPDDLESPEEAFAPKVVPVPVPQPPVPWPTPALENTPAALVPIPVLAKPPPLGTWSFITTERGSVVPMVRRDDEDGFTLLEERVLRAVDLAEVDRALDDLEVRGESNVAAPWGRDAYTFRLATYRVLDGAGAPTAPRYAHGQSGPRFDSANLDADGLRGAVTRFRRLAQD